MLHPGSRRDLFGHGTDSHLVALVPTTCSCASSNRDGRPNGTLAARLRAVSISGAGGAERKRHSLVIRAQKPLDRNISRDRMGTPRFHAGTVAARAARPLALTF